MSKTEEILLSIGLVIAVFLINSHYKLVDQVLFNDYDSAKKETVRFLDKHTTKLEKISKEALSEKNNESNTYKDKKYYYSVEDGLEYIVFHIGAQGMLGGQYWDLIYCEGDYLDGKTIKIYDEYKETGKGNNVFIIEKIRDNWYYSYQDLDGMVDLDKISVSNN